MQNVSGLNWVTIIWSGCSLNAPCAGSERFAVGDHLQPGAVSECRACMGAEIRQVRWYTSGLMDLWFKICFAFKTLEFRLIEKWKVKYTCTTGCVQRTRPWAELLMRDWSSSRSCTERICVSVEKLRSCCCCKWAEYKEVYWSLLLCVCSSIKSAVSGAPGLTERSGEKRLPEDPATMQPKQRGICTGGTINGGISKKIERNLDGWMDGRITRWRVGWIGTWWMEGSTRFQYREMLKYCMFIVVDVEWTERRRVIYRWWWKTVMDRRMAGFQSYKLVDRQTKVWMDGWILRRTDCQMLGRLDI